MVISMQGWQRVIRRFGKKTCLFSGYMVSMTYLLLVTMVMLQLYIPTVISFAMLPMLGEDESEQEGWWKIAIVYVDAVINGFGISGMYLAAW